MQQTFTHALNSIGTFLLAKPHANPHKRFNTLARVLNQVRIKLDIVEQADDRTAAELEVAEILTALDMVAFVLEHNVTADHHCADPDVKRLAESGTEHSRSTSALRTR